MGLLIFGLAVLGVLGIIFTVIGEDNIFCLILGAISSTIAVVGSIFYCFLILQYVGAEHKASIINREYGTAYTQEEVFYASSVIETVRELDRKRMEINGDIITGK